jgi:hypothetical protein
MKNSIRLLLASASLLLTTFSAYCLPAVQSVTIDLTNKSIQGGHTLLLSNTTVGLVPAPIYYYTITGTLTATGKLQSIFPAGSIADLFQQVDPGIVPYLSGTLLNVTDKLPFPVVNILKSGTAPIGDVSSPLHNFECFGRVHMIAGISKTGVASIEFTNLSFGVKSRIPGISFTDTTDAFTFTSGQIVISANPQSSAYQPDLSYYYAGHLDGVGVTGTNSPGFLANLKRHGQVYNLPVVLQNSGTNPDTYTLTATKPGPGFAEAFVYKAHNITAAVTGTSITTGSAGYVLPPDVRSLPVTLPPGGIAIIIWQMRNTTATPGIFNFTDATLTATSDSDPTAFDQIIFDVLAENIP